MDGVLARLSVPIVGDLSPLNAALSSVRSTLRGFAGLGSTVTRALGLGMVAGLGASVKAAIDLESSYSQLRKTTGLTGEQLEQLKGKLQAMATTMAGVSLSDINDIAILAGRLGITGVENIEQFTRSIAKIRIALDDIPAEEAATHIAKMLNQFGLGIGDVERFGSALNRLDDSSTASGREILDVTRRLSGAAATMKMTAAETLALGTTLIDAGINAGVGGTAVSKLIGKMATDTEKFAKISGVSAEEFAKTFTGSPIKALQMFGAAMARLAPGERMEALKSLKFGGSQTGMPLLQLVNILPRLSENLATANREWATMASLDREVAIQSDTTRAQLVRLWNQTVLIADALGRQFLPSIKAITGSLPQIQSAFADLASTPYAAQFTENVTLGFGSMGALVEDVMATITATIRNWDLILEDAGLYVEQFVSDAGGAFTYLMESAAAVGNWFGGNWLNLIRDALTMATRLFTNAIDQWGSLAGVLFKVTTDPAGALLDLMGGKLDKLTDFSGMELKTEGLQLPEFHREDVTSDRRKALAAEMLSRQQAAEDKARGAKAEGAGGNAPMPGKGAGPEATGEFDAGGGKAARNRFALEEFSKHLNDLAMGKEDHAKKTADATQKMNTQLDELPNRLAQGVAAAMRGGVPGVAVSPAV